MGSLNINDLTDEEKKALGIPVDTGPSPFTQPETATPTSDPLDTTVPLPDQVPIEGAGNMDRSVPVNPDFGWQQLLDLDEPDIKREQQDQVFDGSTYVKPDPKKGKDFFGLPSYTLPLGLDLSDPEAKKTNDALYKEQGHALIPGWESGPRLQDSVDKEGSKETSFVPPASFGPVERTLAGGALEAAKGVATLAGTAAEAVDGRSWANFLTQNLPLSAKMKEELKLANPDAVEYIKSNFPTMPAASPVEKMAQEITSIVIGGMGGAKLAEKAIEKLPSAQRLIAQNAQDFLESFKATDKVDVVNAQQKTEAFIKSMVVEFAGANLGATITTPDDAEALTGNTFLDNTVASGVFRILGLGYKGARNLWAGTHGGGSAPITETGLAASLFKQVDPDVSNVSQDELMRRMQAFSNTIKDNSSVTNRTFGDTQLGPAGAMYQGARAYVDEAYGYLKNSLGNKYEEWANAKAGQVADALQAFKRDNLSSPIVQQADATILDKGKQAIEGQAAKLGGNDPFKAQDAAGDIAFPILRAWNNAKSNIRSGEAGVEMAQDRLDSVANGNAFLEAMNQNQGGTIFDNDAINIANKKAKALDAQANWKKSRDDYKGKFGALPSGQPFDTRELSDMLEGFGNKDQVSELFNMQGVPSTNKFKKITGVTDENGVPIRPSVEKALMGKDMKWLVTEARPYFTQQLEAQKFAAMNGTTPTNIKEYEEIIHWIDGQAENYPGFKAAKEAYAEHMNKWGQLEETQRLNVLNKQSDNAIGKGEEQTHLDMYNFQDQVLKNADDSGVRLTNWMRSFDVSNKEAGKFVMNELVSALASVKPQDAYDLVEKVRPFMPKLQAVDEESYNLVKAAMDEVEQAKSGLGGANDNLAMLKKRATEEREKLADTAAFKFIDDRAGGDAHFASEEALVRMERMFASPSETKKLFTEARALQDPLVEEGLQSQYLKYMVDNVFGSRVVSATGSGRGVTEASLSKLNDILDGSDKKFQNTFDIVFENNPQFKDDFNLLLKTLRDDANVRSNRPQTFSSNTAVDAARNSRQKAASLLTTIIFGRLNRTAATVGALATALNTAKTATDEQALLQILPILLTDSKKLTNVLDEIVKNPKPEDVGYIVDKLVDNSAALTNTAKGVGFTTLVPEKEDDTEKALGVK